MSNHRAGAFCLRCHSTTLPDTWSILVIIANILGGALVVFLSLAVMEGNGMPFVEPKMAATIVCGLTAAVMFLGGIRLAYRASKRLFSSRVLYCSVCGSQDLISEDASRARRILNTIRSPSTAVSHSNLERLRIATAEALPIQQLPSKPADGDVTPTPSHRPTPEKRAHQPDSKSQVVPANRTFSIDEERAIAVQVARDDMERFKAP